ncbi:MarR family winged helix-turn-helix transcriptional regulator [Lactiplantibacillus fabifermentans]|uniref:MarR family winged helix-turn-helix transcriptional regulator n=1 Tax=Lactiplantibacillus fabifermentans TaxID=483011 RepID=UPI00041D25D3|nr:MarR family winged helix-turn-helix transcriptional regulator [Lactiplantibacillus fabifermentans]
MRTNELGKYIGVLHRLFQIAISRELTLPELNATNANFLLFISEHDQVTAKQIATELAINKGLVSRELTRLEAAGYIERQTDAADHRTTWVRITPLGLQACQTINDLMSRLWAQVLGASDQGSVETVASELDLWSKRAEDLQP